MGCIGSKHGIVSVPSPKMSGWFDGYDFEHVPRAQNEAADELSKLASSRVMVPANVALGHVQKPSIIPSPESDSIFVPGQDTGVAPMDINIRGSKQDSGTDPPNPWAIVQGPDNIGIKRRTGQVSGTVPTDPGTSIQVSGTAQSDPGTSQPMEVDQVTT